MAADRSDINSVNCHVGFSHSEPMLLTLLRLWFRSKDYKLVFSQSLQHAYVEWSLIDMHVISLALHFSEEDLRRLPIPRLNCYLKNRRFARAGSYLQLCFNKHLVLSGLASISVSRFHVYTSSVPGLV